MRFLIGLIVLAPLMAQAAQNLQVELRWTESAVSGAAMAGVRDGGYVVGTAGSVSPRPGGVTISTARASAPPAQRLVVMNGKSASITLTEPQTTQWLDYAVEMPTQQGGQPKVYAAPRTSVVERSRGFVVTPRWAGGKRPVEVELKAMRPREEAEGGGEEQVLSHVQVPLGEWITVARTGAPARAPERGVTSSRDAEPQSSRELQLRVTLAP
ncbi:hypothetical protein [Pelomonas sp. KK5]|uniref:hypothetical protein n=1 Tax=Pelomonas sp. KK5 TaxID=1855730 RepID=UPI00117CEC42|nr:hypothetical protein [Pelomonas sp. KK5]